MAKAEQDRERVEKVPVAPDIWGFPKNSPQTPRHPKGDVGLIGQRLGNPPRNALSDLALSVGIGRAARGAVL